MTAKHKRRKKFRINDRVRYENTDGYIVGIISRGKGYKEYECIFPDKNGEATSARLPHCCLKKIDKEEKFGFNK